jgi:hypothetical protein
MNEYFYTFKDVVQKLPAELVVMYTQKFCSISSHTIEANWCGILRTKFLQKHLKHRICTVLIFVNRRVLFPDLLGQIKWWSYEPGVAVCRNGDLTAM